MSDRIKLLLTEDLSPHKIALLFLVVLYASDLIPQHHVRLVLLILSKLLEFEPLCDENGDFIVVPQLIDLCKAIRRGISESEKALDGDKLVLALLQALWRINSVESMNTYIINTFSLLLPPLAVVVEDGPKLISPRSFIGDFIQKIVTTFRLLHFDEEFLLYESLVEYRESSRDLFLSLGGIITNEVAGKNQSEDDTLFAALNSQLITNLDISIPTPSQAEIHANVSLVPVPKHDMQALLDKQVQLLEAYGTETPKLLRKIMVLMASPDANTCLIQNANFNNLPSYYYLRYLEHLHESDYHGAFLSLHQYFDYMVSKSSKYFYHFALISRASLHQHFGEDEKALDAMEEAISVARENKDNSTLTYILSWLFNFIRNKPELWKSQNFYQNNNEMHLLDFLIKKSHTVSLLLYAMSYHFETVHNMNVGGPMYRFLESLIRSTFISLNDEIPSFIKSAELAATVWTRIGIPSLSDVYSDMALEYSKKIGKLGDEVSIEIRRNYALFLKGDTEEAYKNIELMKENTQSNTLLFKTVQIRGLIMVVKNSLKKGRLQYAEKIAANLMAIDVQDFDLKLELVYIDAEVQDAMGNHSKALHIISNSLTQIVSDQIKIQSNAHTVIRLSLLKCSILNRAGAFTRAISLVIQQIQRAKQLGFTSLVVEGLIIFASVLNKMDSLEDVYEILDKAMPTILSLQMQELTSAAYYEFAMSCYLMVQKASNRLNLTKKNLLNNFLTYLMLGITGAKRTLNLVLLKQCFELEALMGQECFKFAEEMKQVEPLDDLNKHSHEGLKLLSERAVQEADYGFIVNYS